MKIIKSGHGVLLSLSVVISVIIVIAASPVFAESAPPPLSPKFTLDITAGGVQSTQDVSDTTLGDALTELSLIGGTVGEFGLMVDTVNGKAANADEHTYWAFYINGEYAVTGVDVTPVAAEETYTFCLTNWDTNAAQSAELTVKAYDYGAAASGTAVTAAAQDSGGKPAAVIARTVAMVLVIAGIVTVVVVRSRKR